MPYFLNVNIDGLISADSNADGYSISLKWATAYPTTTSNTIVYNIYMSSDIAPDFPNDFFNNPPTFISVDGSKTITIVDLIPGQMYHFAVRAAEYNKSFFDISTLPAAYSGLVILPESLLSANITATSAIIPLVDASLFPNNLNATVKIGSELINYSSVDYTNNLLILYYPATQRGYNGSVATIHDVDGYDGYVYWTNPDVIFWPVETEEQNTRVFECWNRFDIGHYPFTIADGYRQTTVDILTTNLTYSDEINGGISTTDGGTLATSFPAYDFAGYHRTDPVLILNGTCVGSYIGGYQFCSDGYNGVGLQIRGISAQDANLQRQEVLLSTTGEPVCLVKREWTGITCECMLPYNEYPEARCNKCLGTGKVVGYKQFFYPRRSDGRIMVRFGPSIDDLVATDSGLESTMAPELWTTGDFSLKDRDFLVRFDEDGNEEFRYEILNVTRNKLLLNNTGVQKFAVQRIRKTDVIYQVPVFRNTAMYPMVMRTGVSSSLGIPSHSHFYTTNQIPPTNARQITSVSASHSHILFISPSTGQLTVSTELGHSHSLT